MENISRSIDLKDVRITGGFWKQKCDLVRTEVLPYQWKAIHDEVPGAEPSFCIHNFEAAAQVIRDRKEGKEVPVYPADVFEDWPEDPSAPAQRFYGPAFQDTDAYKWIEAAAFSLAQHPDRNLEETVDRVIDLICSAQEEDGYLDTHYTLTDLSQRFTNLRSFHELYCFGHLAEAACAYYRATGKDRLLKAACRFADCIADHIGEGIGKRQGVPGHEIAEMALAGLYETTGEKKYLELGRYFINQRGQSPNCFAEEQSKELAFPESSAFDRIDEKTGERVLFSYQQADRPVREQTQAQGHAVRAVYLYTGMADYARIDGDDSLKEACEKLWEDITDRNMYVTGGIGGTHVGEAFSFAYDLPNDTVYAETCASVGMSFFARRMLELEPDGRYADICERELYNGVLPGIALDGKSFFYVNPLDVWPKADHLDARKAHVYPVRRKWMRCACCPPNLARLLTGIAAYTATENDSVLFLHQYFDMELVRKTRGGILNVKVESGFPWDGHVKITVTAAQGEAMDSDVSAAGSATDNNSSAAPEGVRDTIALRLPAWCRNPELPQLPGSFEMRPAGGYLYITGVWKQETIAVHFPMETVLLQADSRVREDIGKVCVARGPLIYCAEEADNGDMLDLLALDPDASFEETPDSIEGQEIVRLTARGWKREPEEMSGLYGRYRAPVYRERKISLIPYFTWANRGENEMKVWLNVRD